MLEGEVLGGVLTSEQEGLRGFDRRTGGLKGFYAQNRGFRGFMLKTGISEGKRVLKQGFLRGKGPKTGGLGRVLCSEQGVWEGYTPWYALPPT